jgi:hypothetical protein
VILTFNSTSRLVIMSFHQIRNHININSRPVECEKQAASGGTGTNRSPASRYKPCDVCVIDIQNHIDRFPHARVAEQDCWCMRKGSRRLQWTQRSAQVIRVPSNNPTERDRQTTLQEWISVSQPAQISMGWTAFLYMHTLEY